MNVTREIIIDLLPVYLAGEASMDTRALVESFLKQDPELAGRIRSQWMENMTKAVPSSLPPELELRALRRTRGLLGTQKWLLGLSCFLTAMLLSNEFRIENGHIAEFHFLIRNYPAAFSICAMLAAAFWISYFYFRHRLRTSAP
jgi:anti-sigma factor RsiW